MIARRLAEYPKHHGSPQMRWMEGWDFNYQRPMRIFYVYWPWDEGPANMPFNTPYDARYKNYGPQCWEFVIL